MSRVKPTPEDSEWVTGAQAATLLGRPHQGIHTVLNYHGVRRTTVYVEIGALRRSFVLYLKDDVAKAQRRRDR